MQALPLSAEEHLTVWELELEMPSYKKWKEENKSSEFAPFLKSHHVKKFPLSVEILSVDEQKLPQTGKSLVARIKYDAKIKAKLKEEYIEALDEQEAKDIGFPLNRTNEGSLAELFGDDYASWKGTVQLMAVPVNNPNTGKVVQGLVILTQGASE